MGNESLYIARIFRLQEKKKEKVCQKWPELFLSPVSPGVQIIPRSYSECYKSSVKIEKFRDLKVPRRRKFPTSEISAGGKAKTHYKVQQKSRVVLWAKIILTHIFNYTDFLLLPFLHSGMCVFNRAVVTAMFPILIGGRVFLSPRISPFFHNFVDFPHA